MSSILPRVFAVAARPRTMTAARTVAVRAYMSTQTSNDAIQLPSDEVPHKPNPEGPVFAGYQEFLDDIKAKADRMEAHINDVDYGSTVKWMDPKDIEDLMDLQATHKREMKEQLEELRRAVEAAKTNYAVDAPDGECDGHLEDEMEEVNHIIEEAAHKKAA